MLSFSATQTRLAERQIFDDKFDRAFAAHVPEWAAIPPAERHEFIAWCLERSGKYGLLSEQSVAAYGLGALWMGAGFEEGSPLLTQLLGSPVPELRKAHGLSEWVADQLGPTATRESGDAAIRSSFALTAPWGRS